MGAATALLKKHMGKVGVIDGALTAYTGIDSYNTSRAEGQGVLHSGLTAAADMTLPLLMGN